MGNFSVQFPTTTTNAPTGTTAASSSSNVTLGQQRNHPQNAHFPVYGPSGFPEPPSPATLAQYSFPAPYFAPYYQSLQIQFPYMNTFHQVNQPIAHPMYSYPMGQNAALSGMPNWQPQGSSEEEERKMKRALSKIARDKRKQARQRSRSSTSGSSASSIPAETWGQVLSSLEANARETVTENRNPYTFCSPDGKMLKEVLTKKLKTCDVGSLGRIVLPKREAEKNLPALNNKEGTQILLEDVYSAQQYWSMKFRYWINNKSRMYVLENTGEFVKHHGLQIGDSVILYEDEQKNLYVSVKKEQRPEVAEPSSSKEGQQPQNTYNSSYIHAPYTHQAKDEEEEASLALLIEELNHMEQEAANSLLSLCGS